MVCGRPQEFESEEALDKAMDLFWSQSYEATGLKELLSHMGIARQSLYNTFGDKRSLFLKAITYYEKTIARSSLDQLDAPGSPLENIRQVIRTWEDSDAPNNQRGCLLMNTIAELGSRDPELADILRRHIDYSVEAFQRTLERAKVRGELSANADSRSLARALVNNRNGLALLRKVQTDPYAYPG